MNCGFNYSGCGCNSYNPFITNHLDVVDATAVTFQAMDAVVVAVVSVLQTGLPLS